VYRPNDWLEARTVRSGEESIVENWSELMAARYLGPMRIAASMPVLALLSATACIESSTTPDLVSLSGLSPQVVELGETLQVSGRGFPEGVPARLSFRGDVFRAGQAPERNVDIIVRTQDTSKDTVTLSITDELEKAFCGVGDLATHATFRGNVSVAFSAPTSAMAPVSGTLRDVHFEIEPKVKSNKVEQQRQLASAEAQRFLGLILADTVPSDCCTVTDAQGRALLAGIKPGDRLLDFDGVSVIRPVDLVPSGRNRTARITVRRNGSQPPLVRNIDVQGFRWAIPSELAPAFGCLVSALGIFLAAISPIRRLIWLLAGALAHGFDEHVRQGRLQSRLSTWYTALRQCTSDVPLPESASTKVASLLGVVALGSLSAVMAVREELISADLDLPLWWLVTTITLTITAFVLSVTQRRGGLGISLVFAAQASLHQVPLLTLIASIIFITKTSRLADIVHAQGGWPQDWLIVHDPALAIAAVLVMAALIPSIVPPRPSMVANSCVPRAAPRLAVSPSTLLVSFVANRVHVWVQALLLSTLLLGGWSVPGIVSNASNNQGVVKLVAIAILLTKTWSIIGAVSIVRCSVGSLSLRHSTRWLLRWGLLLAIATSFLTCAWTLGIRYWAILWADAVIHWVMLWLLAVAIVVLLRQTIQRLRSGWSVSVANPWL